MAEFKLPSGWNLPGMDLTPQKVQKIESIPAAELHHYENHVFQLYEDERKSDMIESIKENGILTPLIVREKGVEYEILAGHNRFECGKAAGITEFPCIIKNVDDEEAELIVTVTNLHQRSLSDMSHSQKARAIKTYYNAVKSQGKRNYLLNEMKILIETAEKADEINENSTSRQVGEKSQTSIQKVADQAGESQRQVQRYIRLTELIPELMDMVDEKKIALNPAYELSFLKKEEQVDLLDAMDSEQATPSLSQAQRLKKYSQEGHLTLDMMRVIMGEEKKSDLDRVTFTSDTLRKYFPKSYTPARMQETIIKLLEAWQKKRQRDQER